MNLMCYNQGTNQGDEFMEYHCWKCKNHYEITTDAVACCNCCDDGEFYDPIEEESEEE